MVANWPPGSAENPPQPPAWKSFADVVAADSVTNVDVPDFGCIASYRGEPSLRFSKQEMMAIAEPFRNALVGRFAFSRPPMEIIRKFFVSLGLKGNCSVGLLDSKHVLIRPMVEEDYTRLFVRRTWFIQNSPMTISKWSLEFRAGQESSVVPIWVSFPELPIPFFNRIYLQKLAQIIGRPLKVDSATSDLKRPSVARVLVEIDVAKVPIKRLWMGDENYGFWQKIEYENWPSFCSFCDKVGHEESDCFKKNPTLRPQRKLQVKEKVSHQVYLPNNQDMMPIVTSSVNGLISASVNEPNVSAAKMDTLEVVLPYQVGQSMEGQASTAVVSDSVVVSLEQGVAGAAGQVLDALGNSGQVLDALGNSSQSQGVNLQVVLPQLVSKTTQTNLTDKRTLTDQISIVQVDTEALPSQREGVILVDNQCDPRDGQLTEPDSEPGSPIVDALEKVVQDAIHSAAGNIINELADRVVAEDAEQGVSSLQPNHGDIGQTSKGTYQGVIPCTALGLQRPHFKDVFEEVEWENSHGLITYMQIQRNKSFLEENCSRAPQTTSVVNNGEEDHLQSDKDQNIDGGQYTQVISKKARRRKQYCNTVKTMQTRQDFNSKTQVLSKQRTSGA